MHAAEAIAEMMQVWSGLFAKVREEHPQASDEEVYQMARSLMNRAVGIKG